MKKIVFLVCALLVVTGICRGQEQNRLSVPEQQAGFELLFDGKTLSPTIWQSAIDGYPSYDGFFRCEKGGNLMTRKTYDNFVFRFEFKLPSRGNNGLGIRAPKPDCDVAYSGIELQILAEDYTEAAEWQKHGSIYGVVPAKTGALKPNGEWNTEEVIALGPKIKVVVNGQVIVDADITDAKPIHEAEHPGLQNKTGFLGFLGHGDPVEFRNVRVLKITDASDVERLFELEKAVNP
ncbi:MAG: DUF1080 domain-containing protein [Planctomycetia bacterium]|nr:DUF1080 domain-containing protein [Planctomycetia bacterium]